MAAYCFFNNIEITNHRGMEKYRHEVFATVQKFGGEYIVIGGNLDVKEGAPSVHFPVMIKFPSMERAQAWYHSPEYADLLRLRKDSGQFEAFFMDGIDE